MEGSSNSGEGFDRENVLVKSVIQPINLNFYSSDGHNSSVAYINEGCESPSSSSSWDSKPEIDIPSVINCHEGINLEENYLDMEEQNQFVGVENTDYGLLWEMDNRSYDELLKKFLEKEEELRFSNFRLQLSEQEIIKFNVQVENSEAQLHNVREELKRKEEELIKQKELSKEEIFKLNLSQEEIFKLKIQIDESENLLDNVHEELKLKEEELKLKEEELSKLKELLEKEIFKLKIQTEKSEDQLDSVREELELKEEELNKLKELSEKEIFKLKIQTEKSEDQLDSVREELELKEEELNKLKELSEKEIFKLKIQTEKSEDQLDSVREELELKEEELNKLKELSEEETLKLKIQIQKSEFQLHYVRTELKLKEEELNKLKELSEKENFNLKIQKEEELNKLKELDFWTKRNIVLTSKLEDCQSRNKELENKLNRDRDAKVAQEKVLEEEINCLREELGKKMHLVEAANKEKEMVVIERNEAKTKIKKLEHEILSCNDILSNTRGYVKELEASLTEIGIIYKTIRNEGKMLKLRMEELEKEVTRQNGVISDKDEEKREAIRQLCYSVEYHRSEYRQLVQAINKVASPSSPWSRCYSFLRLH
ncbi:unnamed protein product [Trifolium pratense]|uniref:Uncharacterized protein n=1 Tax=Trifolium pratense TaxID=57577 RepID=A0ACB0JCC0_TRIPR|nr:unnamed protein product [Trifolium pratense]